MDLRYSYEKLGAGIQLLATHPGKIHERLIAAFNDSLWAVNADLLPEEPRDVWRKLRAQVTTIDGTGTVAGTYAKSIQALSVEDAVAVAQEVCIVESMVGYHLERAGRAM